MQVGTGFHKVTEEGTEYISVSLDEVIKLQHPLLGDLNITLWQNTNKKNNNSPDWNIQIKKKQAQKNQENEEVPM